MSESKACTRCGAVKELEEFRRKAEMRDGLSSSCKECCKAAYAAWYADNLERKRAYDAAYRAANLERTRVNSAAWYAANRQRKDAATAAWAAANRQRKRVTENAWRAAHPDKDREKQSRRRAQKRNAPVVERIYRAKVWARDSGRCHICGKKADPNNWHLEHIVALADGGEHSYRNVAVSHPVCNLRKGVRGPGQPRLVA